MIDIIEFLAFLIITMGLGVIALLMVAAVGLLLYTLVMGVIELWNEHQ